MNRASTIELPRKPARAFFRWEAPGEPIAVYFHLNVVDLLGREAIRSSAAGVAGVLLGRIEHSRKLTLIVEDYEPTLLFGQQETSEAVSENRDLLETAVDHWHSGPEKRISLLGLYRSCKEGEAYLGEHDFEILTTYPAESERVFLLIEPHADKASSGTLFMIRNGSAAWKWHSVFLNRRALVGGGATAKPSISSPQNSPQEFSLRQQEREASERRDVRLPSGEKRHAAYRLGWALGISASLVVATAGTLLFHGMHVPKTSSIAIDNSHGATETLGLKLERNGSDWQLSWDQNAPVLRKATAGYLLIGDGSIHKTLNLDMSELQTGSVTYTPITDDVALRLDVVNAELATLGSESVRIVAGVLSPTSDQAQNVGGSTNSWARPMTVIPPVPAPKIGTRNSAKGTAAPETEAARSLPGPWVVPSTGNPSATLSAPEIVNPEATVRSLNLVMPWGDPMAPQPLLTAPSQSDPSANELRLELSSPTRSGEETATPDDTVRPAQLILRKNPIYPPSAKLMGATGTVEVEFYVSANGKVEDVHVVKGPPLLSSAAVDAVLGWRYKPAQVNGTPVKSEARTTFVFTLE